MVHLSKPKEIQRGGRRGGEGRGGRIHLIDIYIYKQEKHPRSNFARNSQTVRKSGRKVTALKERKAEKPASEKWGGVGQLKGRKWEVTEQGVPGWELDKKRWFSRYK